MSVNPFEPLNLGDLKDDDGPVIDSLDVEVDAPPEPADMPIAAGSTVSPGNRPLLTNRLKTGYQVVTPTMDPIQLLPSDAHRHDLEVRVTGGATDSVRLSDDAGKLQEPASSSSGMNYRLFCAGAPWGPDNYTGPVWVSAKDAAANVTVTWYSVTGETGKD